MDFLVGYDSTFERWTKRNDRREKESVTKIDKHTHRKYIRKYIIARVPNTLYYFLCFVCITFRFIQRENEIGQ